jgi:3-oxoacyl-[acyl-carrier-protein] synthase-3
MSVGIIGTGAWLPQREVTNEHVHALVPDAPPEWIVRKTGIHTRRYAAPDEATSDLASRAADQALRGAGLAAGSVDYLLVSTSTGDFPQPPTACLVQDKIGARNAACFDVNAVCSGFIYAVEVARSLVMANPGTHALVIGADLYSRFLDYSDRRTAVLLGDGAGAVLVGEVAEPYGIISAHLSSYGDASELIKIEAGGSRLPASARTVAEGRHCFTMQGRGVRDFVFDNVPALIGKLLASAGTTAADVDCFIPHQANGVLIGELAVRCGLEHAHRYQVVGKYGNLGSASIPVTLHDAIRHGAITAGDLVLLAGFGGGMTAGACLLRWAPTPEKGILS